MLSIAAKLEENVMKFDSRSADAFGQIDLVVNKAGISNGAPLAPRRKDRAAAGRKAAMLAFAAGLLVAALGAGTDEPARAQPTAERAATHSVRVQPTANRFAAPNRPDVSASDAIEIDTLYRQLIGSPLETSSGSRSNTPTFGGSDKR
jgi:hypothetical protein